MQQTHEAKAAERQAKEQESKKHHQVQKVMIVTILCLCFRC